MWARDKKNWSSHWPVLLLEGNSAQGQRKIYMGNVCANREAREGISHATLQSDVRPSFLGKTAFSASNLQKEMDFISDTSIHSLRAQRFLLGLARVNERILSLIIKMSKPSFKQLITEAISLLSSHSWEITLSLLSLSIQPLFEIINILFANKSPWTVPFYQHRTGWHWNDYFWAHKLLLRWLFGDEALCSLRCFPFVHGREGLPLSSPWSCELSPSPLDANGSDISHFQDWSHLRGPVFLVL